MVFDIGRPTGVVCIEMNLPLKRKCVGIVEKPPSDRYEFLFNALAQLYPVEFRRVLPGGLDGLDAAIVLDGNESAGLAIAGKGVLTMVMVKEGEEQVIAGISLCVLVDRGTSKGACVIN